jgi:hypothetical protein
LKALTEKWGGKVVVSEAFDTTIAELSANKPDQFDYIFISRIDQEERTEQFIESRLSNDATKRSQTVVINNIKNLAGDSAINSKFNFTPLYWSLLILMLIYNKAAIGQKILACSLLKTT